jgi:hypothetical protein
MANDYLLAIHFHAMGDEGLAKRLFNSRKVFLASIVPNLLDRTMKTEEGEDIYERIHPVETYYPEWAKEIFRENKNNFKIIWGQEGYRHCCGKCFDKQQTNDGKGYDPYHEHVCLDGNSQSLDEQIEIIRKGKKLINEELGINPSVYIPPNHLYNKNTLRAAKENGFDLFLTRNGFDYFIPNLIELPPYLEEDLFILPETKKGKSPVRMTYYGENQKILDLLPSSTSLIGFRKEDVSPFKIWVNEKLIFKYKKLRDVVNLFR